MDWSALRCFASTGEASAPEDSLWLMARAGYRPVMEVCGGTELAGGYMASTLLQPQSPSTFSLPAFGARPAAPLTLQACPHHSAAVMSVWR